MNYEIKDKNTTYIDDEVIIGEGTIIYPNVTIRGKTIIGRNNIIESNTTIMDCVIGDNNLIISSYLKETNIGNNNSIGPFSHTRNNTVIGNNNKVGNFVELKQSTIKDNNKISHLSYIGNTKMENNVNFSGGAITANFDWRTKEHNNIYIGSNVLIGINSVLVAPIKISKNSFIAAGSVISKDVNEGELAIARAREERKENYIKGE